MVAQDNPASARVPGSKVAAADLAGKFCAICQTHILAGEAVVSCTSCSLPYHAECWQDNGGCAQYGCPSAPHTSKAGPAVQEGVADSWNEDKICPACHEKIKGKAVKCRFCGATFSTREAMSAGEYAEREYEGKEAVNVRNQVVLIFLLSASGVFSPIMAFVTGKFVLSGSCFGISVKRLPPALRVLVVCACCISCLLTFMALMLFLFDR